MCYAFSVNVTATDGLLKSCKINFDYLTACGDSSFAMPPSLKAGSSLLDSSFAPASSMIPSPSPIPYSYSNYSPSDYESGSNSNTVIITAVVISIVVIVMIIIVVFYIFKRRSKANPNDLSNNSDNGSNSTSTRSLQALTLAPIHKVAYSSSTVSNMSDYKTSESLQYDLATLGAATNNFSKENVIGRGGFGFVYKGTLTNGSEIAIKRLSNGSGQGDKEFKAEIELLVYELVPNKSLDYFLFDSEKRQELTWSVRFDIIRGIARGILYLHEDAPQRTVHRDLKAANVLLDAKMAPKIADFGLARICCLELTHVDATRVVGTRGYMAPEYLLYGHFSIKSDVYAFGVLVLEIISGRRIGSIFNHQPGQPRENLMLYAWRCWGEEKPLELMDPLLKDLFSSEEVVKCIHLGLLCVQDDINERPNMSTINHMLSAYTDSATFPEPQYPALLLNNSANQSTTTTTTTQSFTASTGAVTSPYYQNTIDSRTEDSTQAYF